MGLCGGKVSDPKDDEIAKQMQNSAAHERNVVKVLLLGTGESGKSTVFKQMVKLHGGGFSRDVLDSESMSARRNALESMITMCKESARLVATGLGQCEIGTPEDRAYVLAFDKHVEDGLVPETGPYLERLWNSDGAKQVYDRRNEYQMVDSAAYFLGKGRALFSEDFKMTDDDLLRVRVMTTGMKEQRFDMGEGQNMQMLMVDVGGQRSERKKWIKWFYDVYAVIFVTAISEYNQKLFEDNETNRMDESLQVWKQLTSLPEFEETMFILFLNKLDLFIEKLARFPLNEYCPDFTGNPKDTEEAKEYMMMKYASAAGNGNEDMVVHFTTATDTNIMSNVLEAVRAAILKSKLREVGVF